MCRFEVLPGCGEHSTILWRWTPVAGTDVKIGYYSEGVITAFQSQSIVNNEKKNENNNINIYAQAYKKVCGVIKPEFP